MIDQESQSFPIVFLNCVYTIENDWPHATPWLALLDPLQFSIMALPPDGAMVVVSDLHPSTYKASAITYRLYISSHDQQNAMPFYGKTLLALRFDLNYDYNLILLRGGSTRFKITCVQQRYHYRAQESARERMLSLALIKTKINYWDVSS